jgi:SP family sugar:H+ symporter-like MFS transporter
MLTKLISVVPNYASECSPARIRGALINFYQFWLLFGFLMVTIANWKMSTIESEWQYRTVIFVAASVLCPDSPRWLISKGRREEALNTMLYLRKGTPANLVEEEVRLIEENIEDQKRNHYAHSFLDCFRCVIALLAFVRLTNTLQRH